MYWCNLRFGNLEFRIWIYTVPDFAFKESRTEARGTYIRHLQSAIRNTRKYNFAYIRHLQSKIIQPHRLPYQLHSVPGTITGFFSALFHYLLQVLLILQDSLCFFANG